MIRIDMVQQDTRHPDRGKCHPGRASCEVAGRRFETQGPAPVYRMVTLLWLHGHGGERFEVHDDVSPFGRPGGLAMRGKVRNRARLVNGKPNFTRKAQPDPDFTPDERQTIARATGIVIDLTEIHPASGLTGAVCATHPSGDPNHPRGEERASPSILTAPIPGNGMSGVAGDGTDTRR